MSGKAGPSDHSDLKGDPAQHGNPVYEGVTTAISWLTIVPMRGAATFDRITGRRAMAAAPVAGVIPGFVVGVLALLFAGLASWSADPINGINPALYPMFGALLVCATEIVTRAMHIDGLADVADALGSYRDPAGAQAILRDPSTGPMGAATVALVLLVQAMSMGAIVAKIAQSDGSWGTQLANASPLVIATIAGRAAATTACASWFRPMSSTGFGGLTVGTQGTATIALWWALIAIGSWFAAGFPGIFATIVSLSSTVLFVRHCQKKLAGVNGDVLGATIQIAVTVSLTIFAF